MPGNINDFLSSFKNELARPSRFEVIISDSDPIAPLLRFRCETAELPGKTFVTHDQRIYGTIEKYPYQHSYNDINLTFVVSDDMGEKKFFDNWMNKVGSANDSFNFNYKQDYVRDVTITQFAQNGSATYSVKLIDAYPIVVNQLDLDWSTDGHHKLTVVLTYTYWQYIDISSNVPSILEYTIPTFTPVPPNY